MPEKVVRQKLTLARYNVKQRVNGASSHERLLYFSEFLGVAGIPSDIGFLLEAEGHYWSSYLEAMTLAPNVRALLTDLRFKRVKVALVTNLVSGIQYRKLVKLGIEKLFDIVITSQETNGEKSSFEPFALLLKRLDLHDPVTETWFVGDEVDDFPINFPCLNKKLFISPYSSMRKYGENSTFVRDYKQLLRLLN